MWPGSRRGTGITSSQMAPCPFLDKVLQAIDEAEAIPFAFDPLDLLELELLRRLCSSDDLPVA